MGNFFADFLPPVFPPVFQCFLTLLQNNQEFKIKVFDYMETIDSLIIELDNILAEDNYFHEKINRISKMLNLYLSQSYEIKKIYFSNGIKPDQKAMQILNLPLNSFVEDKFFIDNTQHKLIKPFYLDYNNKINISNIVLDELNKDLIEFLKNLYTTDKKIQKKLSIDFSRLVFFHSSLIISKNYLTMLFFDGNTSFKLQSVRKLNLINKNLKINFMKLIKKEITEIASQRKFKALYNESFKLYRNLYICDI